MAERHSKHATGNPGFTALGIPTNDEAGIASAGLLHLAAAIPSLDWGVSLSSPYLSDDLVAEPIALTGGFVNVPTGPGLGIRVDEAKVRRYTREV